MDGGREGLRGTAHDGFLWKQSARKPQRCLHVSRVTESTTVPFRPQVLGRCSPRVRRVPGADRRPAVPEGMCGAPEAEHGLGTACAGRPSDRLIRWSLSDNGPTAEWEGIPARWGPTEPARQPPAFLPWSWAGKNLPPAVPSGDSKIRCKPEFSIRPEGKRTRRQTLRPLLLLEELLSPGCWWLTGQHKDALVAGAQQPPCLL